MALKGRPAARQRAICVFVLSQVAFEDGDIERVVAGLQRAESLARESGDIELLCRVLTKLFIIVVARSRPDAAGPILSDLRRNATKLGDVQTTAGVHIIVAEVDTRKGFLRSAARHLQIAGRLLERSCALQLEPTARVSASRSASCDRMSITA